MHDELRSYDETLAEAQRTPEDELEDIVLEIRPQLTAGFFEHLDNLIHAAHQDEEQCSGETYTSLLLCLADSAMHG